MIVTSAFPYFLGKALFIMNNNKLPTLFCEVTQLWLIYMMTNELIIY